MKKQQNHDDELARELERDADDDAMWEREPVKIERRPSRTSVLSLRLPTAEFHGLLKAARQAGESVSEYVRGAISARVATQQPATIITVTGENVIHLGGGPETQWRTTTAGAAQQEVMVSIR